MAKLKIISVGYWLPAKGIEFVEIESNRTLLDADLVFFSPTLHPWSPGAHSRVTGDEAKGLLGTALHWQREIEDFLELGKNVFVFIREPQSIAVETGRNEIIQLTSYDFVPGDRPKLVNAKGREAIVTDAGAFLREFWSEFGATSPYETYFAESFGTPVLVTKAGRRTVASLVRSSPERGALLFIPVPEFAHEQRRAIGRTSEAETELSRFLARIAEVDGRLKTRGEEPAPEWAAAPEYATRAETELCLELKRVEDEIHSLAEKTRELNVSLARERRLKALLFAKGAALEQSVLDALEALGFTARRDRQEVADFDVVFESAEGRFIGEAEGKDSKPINIDKFRQLSDNLEAYLERSGGVTYAKGVLFGNGFRNTKPGERPPDEFTPACITRAGARGYALIRTRDLFRAARYARHSKDADFARKCREAIARTSGAVVVFPEPPAET